MTPFSSNFDYTKPFSDTGAMISPVANTAVSWTVPGTDDQTYRAEFAFNENDYVWVAFNKTAIIPVGGAATATNQQEMRPEPKYVRGGDVLSFITTQSNVQCGISLLALPSPK